MPYILYKTNGTTLTTVGDASLDSTTDLQFVGRNYSGYGQVVNENFVKLLENFSGPTAPAKSITGQLWYDTSVGRLSINYDGSNFKNLANIYIADVTQPPSAATTSEGDFWWDSTNGQLKAKHGSSYILIGPPNAANTKSAWVPTEEYTQENELIPTPFLEANIGSNNIITISDSQFTPVSGSTLYGIFPQVYRGVTLANTDETGSSQNSGFYFWGTSSDSLKSNTSTTATIAMTVSVGKDESSNTNYYLSFVSTSTGNQQVITSGNIYFNPSTNVLNATATSARYADLAERYEADAVYDEGTVLVIGGEKEVTICQEWGATYWAGIVSKNPAYMMNSEAGSDETHPYIALKGRVPCKVVGPVSKGDMLACSAYPGHAQTISSDNFNPAAIIARALEDFDGDFGVIEVKV
jgi:hypothetical protein